MVERLSLKAALRAVILGGGIVIVTPMIATMIPASMQFPLGTITSAAEVVVAGAVAYALSNYVVPLVK